MFAFDQEHTLFSQELKKYVTPNGVYYKVWKNHRKALDTYLEQLAQLDGKEYDKFTVDQKKALWINAYNALMIKVILDHYPISGKDPEYPSNSIQQIEGVFEDFPYKIAGKDVTFYSIVHHIIRKDFNDPRIHFAVVCGSKDCATLKNSAYTASTLDKDLNQVTLNYMSQPSHVFYDAKTKTIKVSQSFGWSPLDFAKAAGFDKGPPPDDEEIIRKYISLYASPAIKAVLLNKKVKLDYLPYDWSLNEAR